MQQYQPISHGAYPFISQIHQNHSNHIYNHQPHGFTHQDPDNLTYNLEKSAYGDNENPQLMGQSRLQNLNNQMNALEKDIIDNNKQIRLLNNKITKSDFQHAQLKKLYQREQKFKEKQLEFQQILKSQEYLREQIIKNKLKESQIKYSLGQQYQNVIQERKRQEKQQKQREKEQEVAVIAYQQQAIINERQRKRQLFGQQKRLAQQELRQRQYARQLEKQQKKKQKVEYNKVLNYRAQLTSQKDQVYKQYYNHFMEEQQKLQNIYKEKVHEEQKNREKQMREQQQKEYETFQMRMTRQNQQKLRKLTQERLSLRSFLQTQIEQNHTRKIRQKQDELRYQNQVKSYQVDLKSYDAIQKQKRKDLQKRYDNELFTQIQFKNKINNQNVENTHRSSSMGRSLGCESQRYVQRKTHNPVTNPIDFKIGITNPYVIKEYQNTKEKYMGDNNLKLRNLAMVGNNSLMNRHH